MSPNVGLSITCNTNCSHWCPRVLRIFCCCCTVDEKPIHKTHEVSQKVFEEKKQNDISNSESDIPSVIHITPEKEEDDERRQKENDESHA
jgi:hypothetical protein